MIARLSRYHVPETCEIAQRNRTHNRIIDYVRSCLYGDIVKPMAQTIVEHYAADKTRPVAVNVPPVEVSRLLRLDGPSIKALVRALQVKKQTEERPCCYCCCC